MTKKDYTKIAVLIKRFRENKGKPSKFHFDEFADEMADLFAEDSSLFNREKFLKACGMEGGL